MQLSSSPIGPLIAQLLLVGSSRSLVQSRSPLLQRPAPQSTGTAATAALLTRLSSWQAKFRYHPLTTLLILFQKLSLLTTGSHLHTGDNSASLQLSC